MSGLILDYFEDTEIKKHLKSYAFKKGEILLRPHNDTQFIYVIKSGLVKIYTKDSREEENIAVIYGPGYLFPLAWILNKKRPAVYFKTITRGSVYLIPQDFFEKQIKEKTNLSFEFIHHVLEQMALFASTVNSLGYKYGRERIAYRLLVFSAMFGQKKDGITELPHISHSDLGATVNMARETVSKEIAKFEQEGLIEYSRTKIIIKDTDRLMKILGTEMPIVLFDNF